VLAGDRKFWCCGLLASICRGLTIAVRQRGMGFYA